MASIRRLVAIGRFMKISEKFIVRTADSDWDNDTPGARRAQWKANADNAAKYL
jgi:hypothetical protein